MSETELVERAADGDAAAFGLLVKDHQSHLRGFLRRLARGDAALADDVAQDAFLEAWRNIGQFRGEGTFAGWLTRIAFRRYLKAARGRKLEPLDDAEAAPIDAAPDVKLDLEKALALLSLPQRASLTMCFALGYSHEEAAAILEMPVGTLKSHIARGRERVRQLLEYEQ
jgi:RNA polymerase sigma-70 factor (ECF subfamily)